MRFESVHIVSLFVTLVIIVVALFLFNPFYTVDQTDIAVIKTFGEYAGTKGPGLHVRIPLVQSVEQYYVGVDTIDFHQTSVDTDNGYAYSGYSGGYSYEPITALTIDGLEVSVDVSVLTVLKKEQLPVIAQHFYSFAELEQWKIAAIRGSIRQVLALYRADALYGEKRGEVEMKMKTELEKQILLYFDLEGVHIRQVRLPDAIKYSIEQKLQADQEAQKMEFVVQKEFLEAQRKSIEAEGIANYTRIISKSLDPEFLQWYYIQNLQVLGQSPNAKTILIPSTMATDGSKLLVATN
jgi:prohibitin 1